jgi:hypothetical protein
MGVAGGGSPRRAPEQLLSSFVLWSLAKEEKDNAEAQRALRLAEEWWNSRVRAEELGIAVDGAEIRTPSNRRVRHPRGDQAEILRTWGARLEARGNAVLGSYMCVG